MNIELLACSECSNACLTIHKNKRDPNPIVVSFFKIMFGSQFSEVLIVPPKFAKTIMELEGEHIYLEDSTGQKWEVKLSNLNGSLAFQKGWHEFSVDHNIQLGDLLVFYYFKGSHFNVQIFGKSGCEKPMIFGGKDYQNKRAKITQDFVPKNDYLANESLGLFKHTRFDDIDIIQKEDDVVNVKNSPEIGIIGSNQNTNKRPKMDITPDFLVESLAKRNVCLDDERDNSLFDLSIFEIPKKEIVRGMSTLRGNRCSFESSALQITQLQVVEDEEDWLRKESELVPTGTISGDDVPLNVRMPVKHIDFPHISEFVTPTTSDQLPCKRKRIVKLEPNSDTNITINDNLSRDSAIPKKHNANSIDRKFSTFVEEKGQKDVIVHREALNFCDSPTLDVKITCLANRDSEIFLLPKALPVKVCREGENSDQKMVFLKDPIGRIWPVIYHKREGLHILASGWKQFCKSNNIQSGDECTFVLENIDKGILKVQIVKFNQSKVN